VEDSDTAKFNMSRHVKGYQVSFMGLKWARDGVAHPHSAGAEVE